MWEKLKNIGPAALVAAAFIGPGTVTLCSLAGVNFAYSLLWAMAFSVIATIILQEMAARLGIVSNMGLGEALRNEIKRPFLSISATILVIVAIIIGNGAYEAGNIGGAILGMQTIFGEGVKTYWYSLIIGAAAFSLLYIGNYKKIEKGLVFLVIIMSISFVIVAIMTRPSIIELLKGLFVPKIPSGSLLTVLGLIGTTVVPYNLFLHSSIVKERWKGAENLSKSRMDTFISIAVGGLVSMCIIIAAASFHAQNHDIQNASDLALSLEPLYGASSKYFLSLGLMAAGITSAITAPLAAAYAATEIFGWDKDMKSSKFRTVWIIILALGLLVSMTGFKPIYIIKMAQVANGLLLPVIAGFLLWVVNRSNVMGKYVNSTFQNILGFGILAFSLFLGLRSIWKVISPMF